MNIGDARESGGPEPRGGGDAEDPVVPVFIPPLITLLRDLERRRRAPLSEAEVLAIRDGAICMTMRRSMARRMAESRGYDDVDPEDVWRQWQVARLRPAQDADP